MKVKVICEECNKEFEIDSENEHYILEQRDANGDISELHCYHHECPFCNHINVRGVKYE